MTIARTAVAAIAAILALLGCQAMKETPIGKATKEQQRAVARASLTAAQEIAVVSNQVNITSNANLLAAAPAFVQARAAVAPGAAVAESDVGKYVDRAIAAIKMAHLAAVAAEIASRADTLGADEIASIDAAGAASDAAFDAHVGALK